MHNYMGGSTMEMYKQNNIIWKYLKLLMAPCATKYTDISRIPRTVTIHVNAVIAISID